MSKLTDLELKIVNFLYDSMADEEAAETMSVEALLSIEELSLEGEVEKYLKRADASADGLLELIRSHYPEIVIED